MGGHAQLVASLHADCPEWPWQLRELEDLVLRGAAKLLPWLVHIPLAERLTSNDIKTWNNFCRSHQIPSSGIDGTTKSQQITAVAISDLVSLISRYIYICIYRLTRFEKSGPRHWKSDPTICWRRHCECSQGRAEGAWRSRGSSETEFVEPISSATHRKMWCKCHPAQHVQFCQTDEYTAQLLLEDAAAKRASHLQSQCHD